VFGHGLEKASKIEGGKKKRQQDGACASLAGKPTFEMSIVKYEELCYS